MSESEPVRTGLCASTPMPDFLRGVAAAPGIALVGAAVPAAPAEASAEDLDALLAEPPELLVLGAHERPRDELLAQARAAGVRNVLATPPLMAGAEATAAAAELPFYLLQEGLWPRFSPQYLMARGMVGRVGELLRVDAAVPLRGQRDEALTLGLGAICGLVREPVVHVQATASEASLSATLTFAGGGDLPAYLHVGDGEDQLSLHGSSANLELPGVFSAGRGDREVRLVAGDGNAQALPFPGLDPIRQLLEGVCACIRKNNLTPLNLPESRYLAYLADAVRAATESGHPQRPAITEAAARELLRPRH